MPCARAAARLLERFGADAVQQLDGQRDLQSKQVAEVQSQQVLSKLKQDNVVLTAHQEREARDSVYRAMGLSSSGRAVQDLSLGAAVRGLSRVGAGGKTVAEMQAEMAKMMAAGILDGTGRRIK